MDIGLELSTEGICLGRKLQGRDQVGKAHKRSAQTPPLPKLNDIFKLISQV